MKRLSSVLAGAVLVVGSLFLPSLAPAVNAEPSVPGMCQGSTDPGLGIEAYAAGIEGQSPSFSLDVASDASGSISGTMSVQGNGLSLTADDWCRLWQHKAGSVPKSDCDGEGYPDGAWTGHVVGFGKLGDGTVVLVRADVRQLSNGDAFFRLRFKPYSASGHDHETTTTEVNVTTTTAEATTTTTTTTEVNPTTTTTEVNPTTTTTEVNPTTTTTEAEGHGGGGGEDEGHGGAGGEDEGGCESGWNWVPYEGGWLDLDSLVLSGNVVIPSTTVPSTTTTLLPTTTTTSITTTTTVPPTTTTVAAVAAEAATATSVPSSTVITVPSTNTGLPLDAAGWRAVSVAMGLAGLVMLLPPRMRPRSRRRNQQN